MKRVCTWNHLIFAALLMFAASWSAHAAVPGKGPLMLAGTKAEVWGSYKIRQMLFPSEEWEFVVVVVPKDVRQGTLIQMAKAFYTKYPKTRARFFSDKRHIQQYVDRDRYINDTTGQAPEVDFPDSKWVQDHLLGNINNRSKTFHRHWMLEDRYGSNISLLP
jgi:hypothetical protein